MPDDPSDIPGISAYYQDSAACLVRDGNIQAAAQQDGFSRKKHDAIPYRLTEGEYRPVIWK